MPTMGFIANLNYVAIAVIGGVQVADRGGCRSATSRRSSSIPARSAQPITQTASID